MYVCGMGLVFEFLFWFGCFFLQGGGGGGGGEWRDGLTMRRCTKQLRIEIPTAVKRNERVWL